MKAEDFRIGNLIMQQQGKWGYQIQFVSGTLLSKFNLGSRWIRPIPLTEEWLLRFGFEKHTYLEKRLGFSENVLAFINGSIDLYIPDNGGASLKLDVKYVHQLQNLYFELTREELTYTSV